MPTRVGAVGLYNSASGGTKTVAYGQSPTAGNVLLLGVIASHSSLATCTTPTGWTAGPTGSATGNSASIFLFWKIATGGDVAPTVNIGTVSYGIAMVVEEWSGVGAWDANSTVGTDVQANSSVAGNCNSGPIVTLKASDFIWSLTGMMTSTVIRTYTWGGGSVASTPAYQPVNYVCLGTGTQVAGIAGTYTPTLAYSAAVSTYGSATASMAFAPLVIPGNVTAVPAIARGLAPLGVTTGIGASAFTGPAVARALITAPDVLSAVIVNGVAGISRALASPSLPSASWSVQAVPAIARAIQGGPIDIFWNGLLARVGIAHTGVVSPTITAYPPVTIPVYTVAQYRARFLDPQTNVTRRVEILEADGSTLWDDKLGNQKRLISGSVSVDYTRDERRSCDLELANFDGALIHKPDGFWYDKVLRLFRGIEFYDSSGLRTYEVTLGTFMIDRVTQARFPKVVKITARDFTKKCMLSKFTQATGFVAGTAIETIIAAMASNAGIYDRIFPITGKALGVDTFFERDTSRWEAMKQIAEAFGYELFFNAQNFLVMRLFIDPTLGAISHEFKTGLSTGNLVDWEKSTNDTRIFNHVSITGADSNTLPVWAEALNNNPSSPTNIARMGDRTYSQESAFVTTTAQAQALANSYLKINGLEEYDVSLTSIPAPWLEAGEIIRFTDPDSPSSDPDRFLMTSFTIPMDLSPMTAVGRRVTIVS